MLGHEDGLDHIDLSADGFWSSFVGLALMGLIDCLVLTVSFPMSQQAEEQAGPSTAAYVFLSLMIILISYLTSLVALFVLCRFEPAQSRFPNVVICMNWAAPVVSVVFGVPAFVLLVLNAASGGQGNFVLALLSVVLFVAMLIAMFRLIRISLNVTPGQAVGLFPGSTVVSLVLQEWLSMLFGI